MSQHEKTNCESENLEKFREGRSHWVTELWEKIHREKERFELELKAK